MTSMKTSILYQSVKSLTNYHDVIPDFVLFTKYYTRDLALCDIRYSDTSMRKQTEISNINFIHFATPTVCQESNREASNHKFHTFV